MVLAAVVVERAPPLDPPDDDVALPAPDEVVPDAAVPDAGAADDPPGGSEAQPAPLRVTCQPDGCEQWRRPVSGGWDRVVAVDGALVVLEGGELVGVDATTGEDRWRRRVDGVVRGAITGELSPWRPRPEALRVVEVGGRLILTDRHGVLQLREADGRVSWTTAIPIRELWWVAGAGDAVVLSGPTVDLPSPPEFVMALDLADGRPLWTRTIEQGGLQAVGHHGVVFGTRDGLEVLDPVTGEARFTRGPDGDGSWLVAMGPWFALQGHSAGIGDRTWLLDPSDGSVITELPGRLDHPVIEFDERLVALLWEEAASADGGPVGAVALDPDGAVAWHHALAEAGRHDCCPLVAAIGPDAAVVRSGRSGLVAVLDVLTGEPRPDVPVPDVPGAVWFENGLAIGHDPGTDAVVLDDGRGRRIRASGHAWPILTDPPVLLADDELVGLRFTPSL